MIKQIKESELPSIKELDVEVLVIEYDGYFKAVLGNYTAYSKYENFALNFLAKDI